MESERALTPNSDGDHVRRESATPFSYRSALRALLGMSDDMGKHVSYARMVPPVQLRYTTQSLTGQPSHLPEALQETDLSGFDDEVAHDPDSSAGSPGTAVRHHRPLEEKALLLRTSLPSSPMPAAQTARIPEESRKAQPEISASSANPVVTNKAASHPEVSIQSTPRQRDPDATSERDRGLGAATARVEQPERVPEEITIAVPGTSARPQHFPALAPAKQEDRPVSTAGESEGAARARGHQRDTGRTHPPERGGRSAVERTPALASPPMTASADEALARLQGNSVSSANGNVAASIEQLRRTVRELATKAASRQARTPDDPPQQTVQTPPHTVQRVVIIKQAAPRPMAPRAVWERSYLSRLSWRTLR